MSDDLFLDDAQPGLRTLTMPVCAWAWSPDDAHLAFADARDLASATSTLRCVDATGRSVLSVPGRVVLGLAWLSPEMLLVVRAQDFGARAIVHAVPDGGVLGSVALPDLRTHRARITVPALHGGAAPVALVTPWRWHGGDRQRVRRVTGSVLGTSPLEVLREFDPDTWSVVPRAPHARPHVAALSPDGDAIAAWIGDVSREGVTGLADGTFARYDWRADKVQRVCAAGRDVDEMLPCDAVRWALRTAHTGRDLLARGDVAVVDASRAAVRYDSAREDDPLRLPGWVGPDASIDLHSDRARLLVAGRTSAPDTAPTARTRWKGALRVIDITADTPPDEAVAVVARVSLGFSAAWVDDGDAALVLAGRDAKNAHAAVWPSPTQRPSADQRGWLLPLFGRNARRARVTRSPAGAHFTVSWDVDPDAATSRGARAIPTLQGLSLLAGELVRDAAVV